MRRALRENGAPAVMVPISYALLRARLLVSSLVWAGLYHLQRFLVGKRRTSGHWLVQYGAMAAYYLPAPVAFSAASALCYSTSHDSESTPLLLVGIFYMFVITAATVSTVSSPFVVLFTNMRAYSLRDRPGDRYTFLKWLLFLVFVEWEFSRISDSNRGFRWMLLAERWMLLFLHFCTAFIILFAPTAESTLVCETKAVADYMKRRKSSKSSTSSPFFDDDANSNSSLQLLDCCRYPFVQGENGEWVTVKDLVQLMRDDLRNDKDKDIWLSYSLCQLLARRYGFDCAEEGFDCAEEGDDKVRSLALADLGTTDGYKRAFNIVEVELAFLHDYFFTASLEIMESGLKYIDAAHGLMNIFTEIIIMFLLVTVNPMGNELVVTIQMLVAAVMSMFMSYCALFGMPTWMLHQNLLAPYWRSIHTAFCKLNYLPDGPRPFSLVGLFRSSPNPDEQDAFRKFQTQTGGPYWRNKIGQYSILQDYDRRRSHRKELVDWFHRTVLSEPSYWFIKHLPVEEEEVDMQKLDKMRELVADTLQAIDGPPTNGTRSLKINMDEITRDSAGYDWLWTCRQETHTDTILIWHIATCYCDMTLIDDPLAKYHHESARALSRYCAYLVAFLPEFLSEHSLTTKQVFQRVIQEAQQELGTKPMKEEEKRTKIRGLQLPDQHEQRTTFHKGVELGRQLEMIDDDMVRWKVIAEFWAETILYVAPSDNTEAHIEQLAKGGEFITHLWAMLSNAGILKRATEEWHPPASTAKKEPPKKIRDHHTARTRECPF